MRVYSIVVSTLPLYGGERLYEMVWSLVEQLFRDACTGFLDPRHDLEMLLFIRSFASATNSMLKTLVTTAKRNNLRWFNINIATLVHVCTVEQVVLKHRSTLETYFATVPTTEDQAYCWFGLRSVVAFYATTSFDFPRYLSTSCQKLLSLIALQFESMAQTWPQFAHFAAADFARQCGQVYLDHLHRAYAEEVTDKRVKVLIVGDSGAGKTQVCRRLSAVLPFQSDHNSTDTMALSVVNVVGAANWGLLPKDQSLFQSEARRVAALQTSATVPASDDNDAHRKENASTSRETHHSQPKILDTHAVNAAVKRLGTTLGPHTFAAPQGAPAKELVFSMWDFAGQPDFYVVHDLFLTSNSLYLLVFDGSKEDCVRSIANWLDMIASHTTARKILLVCTRGEQLAAERISFLQSAISTLLNDSSRRTLCDLSLQQPPNGCFFVVDSKTDLGIQLLQTTLSSIAETRAQRCNVPLRWLELHDHVITLVNEGQHVLSREMLAKELKSLCGDSDKDSANKAIEYLRQSGAVLHFPNDRELNDLVFIDPQWIIEIVRAVMGSRDTLKTDLRQHVAPLDDQSAYDALLNFLDGDTQGLLDLRLLDNLWEMRGLFKEAVANPMADPAIDHNDHLPWFGFYLQSPALSRDELQRLFCSLLERCGLMCRVANQQFLVPCMLPSERSLFAALLSNDKFAKLPSLFFVAKSNAEPGPRSTCVSLLSTVLPRLLSQLLQHVVGDFDVRNLSRTRAALPLSGIMILLRQQRSFIELSVLDGSDEQQCPSVAYTVYDSLVIVRDLAMSAVHWHRCLRCPTNGCERWVDTTNPICAGCGTSLQDVADVWVGKPQSSCNVNNSSRSDVLLRSLRPVQRAEIGEQIGSVWEKIAVHFEYTSESIEDEISGGSLADVNKKSLFLVEKLAKRGVSLQDFSNAMHACGLAGVLQTNLSHLLPTGQIAINKRKNEENEESRKNRRK